MKKPTLRSIPILATCVTLGLIVALPGAAVDDVRWKNIGIGGGGNMFSAAISPADPNIVLMGSDVGGIFRSSDGGESWQLKNEAQAAPDHHSGYGFYGTFVFDDADPNIVYAGRMKSKDAGLTWADKIEFRGITVDVNVIDPGDPNTVYSAAYGGVYKSLDAWESSWVHDPACGPNCPTSCLPDTDGSCLNDKTSIHSLAADPLPPHNLWACAKGIPDDNPLHSGLYLSEDGGMSWTLKTPPSLPNQNPGGTPRQLCSKLVAHKGSRRLYMTLKTTIDAPDATGFIDIESWKGGVYKSDNWGVDWVSANGTDGANILMNPGFEDSGDATHPAASWNYFYSSAPNSVSRELTQSHDGMSSNAIKIDLTGVTGDSPKSGIESDCLPVDGTQSYKVSGWAKVSGVTGLSLFATVQFYNDNCPDDAAIMHYSNGSYESGAFGSSDPSYDPSRHFGWRKFERIIHPPEGASRAKFWVTSYEVANHGITWVDDVAMQPLGSLPRKTYLPGWLDYREIVADPTNADIAYVGTASGAVDITDGDVGGIYKTMDGGASWQLVTRTHYRDNVMDGRGSSPFCGNGFCQGRWEDCNSCPEDCNTPPRSWCCGNNTCETAQGESTANCEVDCPLFTDPNRPYYEIDGTNREGVAAGGSYGVNSLAIGSGPVGHQVLHFGSDSYRSTDGGLYWTEVSSNLYDPLPGEAQVRGTWRARGDRNGVFTYSVVTDPRARDRVYYGDTDNRLMVSYNGGKSFAQEGWDWGTKGFGGDAATAIVLDPNNADTIYLGISNGLVQTGSSNAAIGTFDSTHPSGGKWTWRALGNPASLPDAGGVGLIRHSSGAFYATVFGLGVYKLPCPLETCNWTSVCPNAQCDNWSPKPATNDGVGWELYPIVEEPTTGRIYVGAGIPGTTVAEPPQRTGVWESTNGGTTWTRISFHDDMNPTLDNNMNGEPVGSILSYGPNTLFAATGPGVRECTLDQTGHCPVWDGDGGLYRGARNGNSWTWARVIHQPIVTGIDVSPADNSILYAFAGQICCSLTHEGQQAGIYKSIDGGRNWHIIANQGLMNLGVGRLYFSASNPRILYASTIGDGVFEGTITCADPTRDFDCATRVALTNQTITGSVASGVKEDLRSGSANDTYEVLSETTAGNKTTLTGIWTFPNALPGVSYELRVEAFRSDPNGDSFPFTFATRSTGTCTSNESWETTNLTVVKTADDDLLQTTVVGSLPAGQTVFCVRVRDSAASENPIRIDSLSLDRLFLLPIPDMTAGADLTTSPGTRTGTYRLTFNSDDSREQLREASVKVGRQSYSRLIHTWQFDNIPAGTLQTLHVEGQVSTGADDSFQFSYATVQGGPYTPLLTIGQMAADQVAEATFSGSISGTVFIRVADSNPSNAGSQLDTISVDHITIKTSH